jgi:ribosomal protein S18 acetylase RimI-like enzyme
MQSSQALVMSTGHGAETLGDGEQSLTISKPAADDRQEVLSFLAARPLHTVFMAGLIRDNGVVSPLNRGVFYACRNYQGRLEGVALIGHATLVEARSVAARAAFARLAQSCSLAHLIRGEHVDVEGFWTSYAMTEGVEPRLVCREALFEHRGPVPSRKPVTGLRQATLADLSLVMTTNAEMAMEECGVNPLTRDALGFRQRTARRIEQGRVWVWVENSELIFKADVVSDTPEAVYLEGIYVHPRERRKGYGLRCMTQLSRILLARTEAVCLVVNEEQKDAQAFYRKAGYTQISDYDTIYLQLH